jgi:hypothetical protein
MISIGHARLEQSTTISKVFDIGVELPQNWMD